MVKLRFDKQINAKAEKVWNVLWNDDTYKKWTSVFSEGSMAKSDWKEGSRIYFVDGTGNGMYSVIDKKINNQQMIFRHLGEVMDGVEKEGSWSGSVESYFLIEENNATHLKVELDSTEEFQKYFEEKFPLALQKVKELAES